MADYFTEHDTLLENKLGITDPEVLKQAEADIVCIHSVKAMEGLYVAF